VIPWSTSRPRWATCRTTWCSTPHPTNTRVPVPLARAPVAQARHHRRVRAGHRRADQHRAARERSRRSPACRRQGLIVPTAGTCRPGTERTMSRITVGIDIDASPERVWEVVEPVEDHVEWMHDAVAIRFQTDQTRGVGTQFLCDTKVGPIRLTDVMEITAWVPARSMGVIPHGDRHRHRRVRHRTSRRRHSQPFHLERGTAVPVVPRRSDRGVRRRPDRDEGHLAAKSARPQTHRRERLTGCWPSADRTSRPNQPAEPADRTSRLNRPAERAS
jgi:hypothetical protein